MQTQGSGRWDKQSGSIAIYTTMCKIHEGKQLHSRGSSAQCSVTSQNGRMGKGVCGREAQEEGDMCISPNTLAPEVKSLLTGKDPDARKD